MSDYGPETYGERIAEVYDELYAERFGEQAEEIATALAGLARGGRALELASARAGSRCRCRRVASRYRASTRQRRW